MCLLAKGGGGGGEGECFLEDSVVNEGRTEGHPIRGFGRPGKGRGTGVGVRCFLTKVRKGWLENSLTQLTKAESGEKGEENTTKEV